jgi:molybdenum cofactor cytidylyltransferase
MGSTKPCKNDELTFISAEFICTIVKQRLSMIGILLAAGFSRRFGPTNKLLQTLPDGRQIGLAAAENLIQALPLTIAVLRPDNKELAALLRNAGLEIVYCHAQEMADSLSTAIRYSAKFSEANFDKTGFAESSGGYVIALADMPYVHPQTISSVAQEVRAGTTIAVPTYQGQSGHPVGFSARFRSELEQLSGDEGARSILKRYADEIKLLACDDAGIIADIDTPADLAKLRS